MRVYVVIGEYEYGGSHFLGVFSTQEKAQEAAEAVHTTDPSKESPRYFDWVKIEVAEVDARVPYP